MQDPTTDVPSIDQPEILVDCAQEHKDDRAFSLVSISAEHQGHNGSSPTHSAPSQSSSINRAAFLLAAYSDRFLPPPQARHKPAAASSSTTAATASCRGNTQQTAARPRRGASRPRAVLSEGDVATIFRAMAEGGESRRPPLSSRILAKQYGVAPKTIRDIWNRRTWFHVTAHLLATPSITPPIGGEEAIRPPTQDSSPSIAAPLHLPPLEDLRHFGSGGSGSGAGPRRLGGELAWWEGRSMPPEPVQRQLPPPLPPWLAPSLSNSDISEVAARTAAANAHSPKGLDPWNSCRAGTGRHGPSCDGGSQAGNSAGGCLGGGLAMLSGSTRPGWGGWLGRDFVGSGGAPSLLQWAHLPPLHAPSAAIAGAATVTGFESGATGRRWFQWTRLGDWLRPGAESPQGDGRGVGPASEECSAAGLGMGRDRGALSRLAGGGGVESLGDGGSSGVSSVGGGGEGEGGCCGHLWT